LKKITHLNSCKYVIPIAQNSGRIVSLSSYYQTNLQKRTPNYPNDNIEVFVYAKFNTQTFDGIQMIAWLENDKNQTISSGSCQFKVYYLDTANNWNQTLIFTGMGSASGMKWIAAPDQTALGGSLNQLDGERTLLIEATLVKFGESYTNRIYVNHLGVYDSVVRLRNDIEFLDISKADL
jgi:hypothetical protein